MKQNGSFGKKGCRLPWYHLLKIFGRYPGSAFADLLMPSVANRHGRREEGSKGSWILKFDILLCYELVTRKMFFSCSSFELVKLRFTTAGPLENILLVTPGENLVLTSPGKNPSDAHANKYREILHFSHSHS